MSVLLVLPVIAKRKWISAETLALITRRNEARRFGDYGNEAELNKLIRSSARKDKRIWLYESLENGGWHAVKKLKRPASVKHATIQALDGTEVSTAERADTLADYFVSCKYNGAVLCQ